MRENAFYLDDPYLKIGINKHFEFIGKENDYPPDQSVSSGLKSHDYFYLFVKTDNNNYIKSGVIVKFRRPIHKNAYWLPSVFKPGNFALEKGTILLGGINFKYSIFASPMSVTGKVTKTIIDKGYYLPDMILVRNIKEAFGPDHNHLIDIYYFEDISDHNYGYSWRGPELVGKWEKEYLSGFINRAADSLKIEKKE
jgi:hypothetical protein